MVFGNWALIRHGRKEISRIRSWWKSGVIQRLTIHDAVSLRSENIYARVLPSVGVRETPKLFGSVYTKLLLLMFVELNLFTSCWIQYSNL
jgi:hypothetical protein